MSTLMQHTVKFFVIFALLWTILVYALSQLHETQEKKALNDLAIAEARAHFEKDILIRSWASSHGGVYVPPSSKTPPNPYLAHLKERDIETKDGNQFTLVNPAYMTRQLHDLAKEKSGIQGHITSLKLTREENKPDIWERKALEAFDKGVREVSSLEKMEGKNYLRYIGALVAEEGCIKCHKNTRVGEVRGGISITLPMDRYELIAAQKQSTRTTTYLSLWAFGIAGICLSLVYMMYLIRKHSLLEEEARKLEVKESFLRSIGEGVYGIESDGTLSFINTEALKLTGYTNEELLGKNPHEVFHNHPSNTHDKCKHTCIIEKARKTGVSLNGREYFFRNDGSRFPVEVRITPFLRDNMSRGAVVLFRDITEELKHEKELEILATTDPLTHIKNKRIFEEWLKLHFSLYKRNKIESYMLMIDIDFFKKVNDTYGHQAGDDVLRYLATIIQDEVREGDCFARIGGEEFALLMANTHEEDAFTMAERLRLSIQNSTIPTCEGDVRITISIGVSSFDVDDQGIEAIISRSDDAMYSAKENGRNQVVIK